MTDITVETASDMALQTIPDMALTTTPDTAAIKELINQSRGGINKFAEVILEIKNILRTVRDASESNPLLNLPSIFGPVTTWISPFAKNGYSEFKILDLWTLKRTVKYLVNTFIPSIPVTPPPFGPPILDNIFWHPTVILQRPDHNGSYTTFPEEAWFYINGIMTNDSIAQLNAAYLANLFHRPITLIQNSTDSLLIDLLECIMGRGDLKPGEGGSEDGTGDSIKAASSLWVKAGFDFWGMTEPVVKALPVIYNALKDKHKEKVVIITHSQGTIIMAGILKLLNELLRKEDKLLKDSPWSEETEIQTKRSRVVAVAPEQFHTPAEPVFVYPDDQELNLADFAPLSEQELAKLEIYCFANCAKEMKYCKESEQIPWIENIGNQHDMVARLGMLAPDPDKREAIDGPCYMHKDTWGHLLNAHYLYHIDEYQQGDSRQPGGSGDGTFGGKLQLLNADKFPDQLKPRLFDYINGGIPE